MLTENDGEEGYLVNVDASSKAFKSLWGKGSKRYRNRGWGKRIPNDYRNSIVTPHLSQKRGECQGSPFLIMIEIQRKKEQLKSGR